MPIDGRKIISSKEALVLRELPESMAVVGSGAIGCEFAYFYASLGVKVTIIEYLPQLLPAADTDVSKALERAFRKMKIGVMTGTTVKDVTVNGERKMRTPHRREKRRRDTYGRHRPFGSRHKSNLEDSVSKRRASRSRATK